MGSSESPNQFDLLALDRELESAVRGWRSWRRRLRRGEGLDSDPLAFYKSVSGRTTFHTLRELSDRDPLAAPLGRWVYRLAEERYTRAGLAEMARERRAVQVALDRPEQGRFTLSELVHRALGDAQRRAGFLEQAIEHAEAASDAQALLFERRAELAERWQVVASKVGVPCPEISDVARQFLDLTRDAFSNEVGAGSLARLIGIALAEDAREGWPARVSERSLNAMFEGTRLFDGLDLDPGQLPQTLAPASFLRALTRLGAAWVDSTAPLRQPFAIRHDAYGLRRYMIGALFASLPLSESFLRRRLGLGRDSARAEARAIAKSLLIALRLAALRVLLRGPALLGKAAFLEAFEAESARTLGVPLLPHVAGVLVRIEVDDAQRFAGALLAADRHERLISEHDEDWFRNPRAIEQLRSEADLSPEIAVARETLTAASLTAHRALVSALG